MCLYSQPTQTHNPIRRDSTSLGLWSQLSYVVCAQYSPAIERKRISWGLYTMLLYVACELYLCREPGGLVVRASDWYSEGLGFLNPSLHHCHRSNYSLNRNPQQWICQMISDMYHFLTIVVPIPCLITPSKTGSEKAREEAVPFHFLFARFSLSHSVVGLLSGEN